jgi:hypothetical protein
MRAPHQSWGLLLGLALAAVAGCAQEEYPAWLWAAQHPPPPTTSGPDAGPPTSHALAICTQTQAQSLPARLAATNANATSGSSIVLVSDVFDKFNEVCAPCHTAATDPPGQGGFQIATVGQFPSLMKQSVLDHVSHSTCPKGEDPSDPYDPMPPCNSPAGGKYPSYAARPESDPIKQFAELVQAWIDAGSPAQSFTPKQASADASAGDAGAPGSFALTPSDGNAMTNIGNCVPSPGLMGLKAKDMDAKDAMFAALKANPGGTAVQAIGLPEHLGDTDLVSLDSATLAENGVIAYAPGYPLWSDNAGKLRHVRVPRGTSIKFNKTTQQFEIPPNTRFYKTFMKQIIDTDNVYRYRKIETRLIVARPDTNNPDGTASAQNALFGSYRWNDSESDAVLVQTPLHDGTPFSDTVLTYNTDENLAAAILAGDPPSAEIALLEANAIRHYAIPSSQRCIQCHMGSPSQDFVLGFTPLQINRRPCCSMGGVTAPDAGLGADAGSASGVADASDEGGDATAGASIPVQPEGTGGTFEPSGPDELNQLERLVAAGVITGVDSPSDILPLEQSQGTRKPRNEHELMAQGYLLGNCTHCHNPRGFPTVQNPILSGLLDFLPSATGGIFQYPLERYTPRFGRGTSGTTLIPYITPSLVDMPRSNAFGPVADPFVGATAGSQTETGAVAANSVIYAPWRSLIYRNVDSVFAYTDDVALFPHMPLNTPGYDPRAKQILGSWMVSIPAARKHPDMVEYAYQTDKFATDNIGSDFVDTEPQPYAEVPPGAPGYDDAVAAAKKRLEVFRTGSNDEVPLSSSGIIYSRYADPAWTEDILDPEVTTNPVCHPIPQAVLTQSGIPGLDSLPLAEHPHWVPTDLTSPPGTWSPRESSWPQVVAAGQVSPYEGQGNCGAAGSQEAHDDQVKAVAQVPFATLDQVRTFATTPRPFGVWQQKPGCSKLASQPKASSYTGASRPHWMNIAQVPDSSPIYSQTPGAAVYKMICINCHGPKADSNGRLAVNLATMTGGNALVADFRNGLFGPVGATGDSRNVHAQFGEAQVQPYLSMLPSGVTASNWTGAGVTDDDRAARYMAWMGLGGTAVNIPRDVLQIVSVTKVLDQIRSLSATNLSANMLSQAKALCRSMLGPQTAEPASVDVQNGYFAASYAGGALNTALIWKNGDAEMWLRLCSYVNAPPVHIVSANLTVRPISTSGSFDPEPGGFVPADAFPDGAQVGTENGWDPGHPTTYDHAANADPSSPGANLWPWCVDNTADGNNGIVPSASSVANLPVCPPAVLAAAQLCRQGRGTGCFDADAGNNWAVRGAINAGFAVYLYVQYIESHSPPPDYNQCEQL